MLSLNELLKLSNSNLIIIFKSFLNSRLYLNNDNIYLSKYLFQILNNEYEIL